MAEPKKEFVGPITGDPRQPIESPVKPVRPVGRETEHVNRPRTYKSPQVTDLRPNEDFSNPNAQVAREWGKRSMDALREQRIVTELERKINAGEVGGADDPFGTSTAGLEIQLEQARKRLEAAKTRLADIPMRFNKDVAKLPSVAAAMAATPGLTEADVRRVVNFAAANIAADRILATGDEQEKINILMTMGPNERTITLDLVEDKFTNLREAAQRANESRSLPGKIGAGLAEGFGMAMSGIFDPIMNFSMRVQAASNIGFRERGGLVGLGETVSRPGGSPIAAAGQAVRDVFLYWGQAANPIEGNYDQEIIGQLNEEYGPGPVALMMELQSLQRAGDPTPIDSLIYKYAQGVDQNTENVEILRSLVLLRPGKEGKAAAERWQRLEGLVNSANLGDPGQTISTTNLITGQPLSVDNPWRGGGGQNTVASVANLATIFGNDPLILYTGKVRAGFLATRYALSKIAPEAGAESIVRTLTRPAVKRSLDDFTKDLARYQDATGVQKAEIGKVVRDRWGKFFPEDVIDDLVKAEVKTTNGFIQHTLESNAAIRLQMGEAMLSGKVDDFVADIASDSMFARMARAQAARRGVPLLPRTSMLYAGRIRRQIGDLINLPRTSGVVKSQGNKDYEKFVADANDPNVSAGTMLAENAPLLGEQQRILTQASGPVDFVARLWDKTTRLTTTTIGNDPIYFLDARDTKRFYKFARMFVGRGTAVRLADDWRNASEAQRRLMWSGIIRTAMYARGFDDIATREVFRNGQTMTVKDIVREITTGLGERYSPSSYLVTYDNAQLTVEEAIQREVAKRLEARGFRSPTGSDLARAEASRELTPAVTEDGLRLATADQIATETREVLDSGFLKNLIDNAVNDSPSYYNGRQHALHQYQLSDYGAVPNLNDLALITKRSKLMQQVIGTTQNSATRYAVDYWSFLTLASPRFAVRNSIEDWFFYSVTGGKFLDAVRGRAASTGFREARGQKLGTVARGMRKIGSSLEKYPMAEYLILPQLSKAEVQAARVAASGGDLEPLRQLAVKAVIRTKLGKTLTKEQEQYLADYAASASGYYNLDELTELARHLSDGTFPGMKLADDTLADPDALLIYPKGEFIDLSMAGNTFGNFSYWHRAIYAVAVSDGPLGKIALENLDDVATARRLVAKEVLEDPTNMRYKDRYSAIYEAGMSIEEFAARYVQDVVNTFSRRDGSLNTELWRSIVKDGPDGKRVVQFRTTVEETDEAGKVTSKKVPAVTIQSLREIAESDRPRYILGRETAEKPIEIPVRLQDKLWDMMGNAFVRMSKEPIYFGNYLSQRRIFSEYESALAAATSPAVARKVADNLAQDRALALSLSYTDNPANQSILAWRMRNYARFYRATEDFYRRAYRAATFEPMSIYKTGLAIGAMDESGFIHEDMNGDKYFIYPGSELVNGLLGEIFGRFGVSTFVGDMPLIFGGKMKMLAPSADPEAALPTLSSPISAFLVKSVINLVPAFRDYEQALIGEYGESANLWQAALPAPILRAFNALNQDERYSAYASAYKNAAQVLEAAGRLPRLGPDREASVDEAASAISTVATNILATRLLLGFVYPASPQIMQNDVTTLARKYGVPNVRSSFLRLVTKFEEEGSPDPFAEAMVAFVATYGTDQLPYTVSRSGRKEGIKNLPVIGRSEEVIQFVQDNGTVVKKFPTASMFIAPADTEGFSGDTNRWLSENGFLKTATTQEFMQRLIYAEGNYIFNATRDDYADQFGRAVTDTHRKAIMADWEEKKAAIYAEFPGLASYRSSGFADTLDSASRILDSWVDPQTGKETPSEIRAMLNYYYDEQSGPIPPAVKSIAEAVATWDYYSPQLDQLKDQNTKAARQQKAQIKEDLISSLLSISSENKNAEKFIQRVMFRLLGVNADGTPRFR